MSGEVFSKNCKLLMNDFFIKNIPSLPNRNRLDVLIILKDTYFNYDHSIN